MKKRCYPVIIIFILVILALFYKIILVETYKDPEKIEILEGDKDTVTIRNEVKGTTQYSNLHLKLPTTFEYSKNASLINKTETYLLKGTTLETDNFKGAISLSKTNNYLESVAKKMNVGVINIEYKKLMTKYNIKDDIDLIKYYRANKDEARLITWSTDKIKMNYFSKKYVGLSMPNGEFTYINGDLIGYVVKSNNNHNVYLFDNKTRYLISFINSKNEIFNKINVTNILKSVYFSK